MICYSRVEIETNFSLHFLVFRIIFPNKIHVFQLLVDLDRCERTIPHNSIQLWRNGIHEEFRCAKKKGPKIGFESPSASGLLHSWNLFKYLEAENLQQLNDLEVICVIFVIFVGKKRWTLLADGWDFLSLLGGWTFISFSFQTWDGYGTSGARPWMDAWYVRESAKGHKSVGWLATI